MTELTSHGHWLPSRSANPGGRPGCRRRSRPGCARCRRARWFTFSLFDPAAASPMLGLRLVHQDEGSGRVRERLLLRNSRARANPASVRTTRSAARGVTNPTLIKASSTAPWHSSTAQLPPAKAIWRSSSACSLFQQVGIHPLSDLFRSIFLRRLLPRQGRIRGSP
jgi:hypothetical protein